MPEFSVHTCNELPTAEVVALYESVGWSTYTKNPEVLLREDILVRPSIQGSGACRAMFEAILSRYRHVRQTVPITDDEPGQRAF
jgi:hypothetical protein